MMDTCAAAAASLLCASTALFTTMHSWSWAAGTAAHIFWLTCGRGGKVEARQFDAQARRHL